jgi:hypothetical protein
MSHLSRGPVSAASFVVVGAVRNCARTLKSDVARIKSSLTGAKSVSWFLVESDSDDDSLEILRQLETEVEGFSFRSEGVLRDRIPVRTDRLAYCRNVYLDTVREARRFKDIDFMVVADFDGINLKISRSGVESCFLRDDWAACFANQSGPYYDVWTLRHPVWSPNDCWEQYEFNTSVDGRSFSNLHGAVYSRMLRVNEKHPWIEVDSAFGGFGIYRKSALGNARYQGVLDGGREVCEHVPLNLEISSSGHSLFINPRLINAHLTEHSIRAYLPVRIFYKVGYTSLRLLTRVWKALRLGRIRGS